MVFEEIDRWKKKKSNYKDYFSNKEQTKTEREFFSRDD